MRSLIGIALIAACSSAGAETIHKCVGKDGKVQYLATPCPGAKVIGSGPAPAAQGGTAAKGAPAATGGAPAGGNADIPEVQTGKWKLRFTRDGRAQDQEMCGDPIAGMRGEVKEYAAKAGAKWGCSMTTTPTGQRNVMVVYDCPSDRSPEGQPVSKGRSEISFVSPSPQAFRIEMKSTAFGGYVMEGTRIGSCP